MIVPVNYIAVLVAAVVAFVIGGAWYSPLLFGKQWMKLRGMNPDSMKGMAFPAGMMIQEFIITLITAFVISQFAAWVGAFGIVAGLVLGLWFWIGFVVPMMYGMTLWEKYPIGLAVINGGLRLVNYLVMAAIICQWQ